MSAGKHGEYPGEPPIDVVSSLEPLAPGFRRQVEAVLADLEGQGFDPIVHESYRSRATAEVYYARGRTTVPPHGTVTNAPNETYSYHGFGLAVDIISKAKGWDAPFAFWKALRDTAVAHGLVSGADWKSPDRPHIQAKTAHASPSDGARDLLASGGMDAVWATLGLES